MSYSMMITGTSYTTGSTYMPDDMLQRDPNGCTHQWTEHWWTFNGIRRLEFRYCPLCGARDYENLQAPAKEPEVRKVRFRHADAQV